MCGIAAIVTCPHAPDLPAWLFWCGTSRRLSTPPPPPTVNDLLPALERRGPDATTIQNVTLTEDTEIQFIYTVLSLRTPSQYESFSDDYLLYNGELYDINDASDTDHLRATLDAAAQDAPNLHALDRMRGPWAFIYWHASTRRLYFGRDVLGRRSLLLRAIPGHAVVITSVPPVNPVGFVEVPPAGLAFLDFSEPHAPKFGLYPRGCASPAPHDSYDANEQTIAAFPELSRAFLPPQWMRSHSSPVPPLSLTRLESASRFLDTFTKSVRRRLVTRRTETPRFAVLFSGGIDSLLIAATLLQVLPEHEPLHLINVAFGSDVDAVAQCPDRVTAQRALAELQDMFGSARQIQLICVDVSPSEADDVVEKHIQHLIYPNNQLMDASIGTAIWLAARGRGYVSNPTDGLKTQIKSSARILFNGLGADELMGGYKGRHRTIFRTKGIQGILNEMDLDVSRLWFRNLGRDDRLVSDHGKEFRHPFLDEELVQFVTSLHLTEHVCDLSQPDGVGDKHLIRRALRLLGFSEEAASRSKRAIQFGSRSKQVIERKRPE